MIEPRFSRFGEGACDRAPSRPVVVALLWLAAAIVLLAAYRHQIVRLTPYDGDDYMRLLQVRDWLRGQSWWDVTQYRMNPPTGGAMHWSRIVDLPIAGVELLLWPLGQGRAEQVAAVVVPLLLLGLLMAALARVLARQFAGIPGVFIGLALLLASGSTLSQFVPLRVDHHGWQILCAAAALAALVDPRPLRAGLLGGAAFAVGLAISIEGTLVAVAAGGVLAAAWVGNPSGCRRFVGYVVGWAAMQTLLFAATTPPDRWVVAWCDTINIADIAALWVAALGTAALAAAGPRLPTGLKLLGLAVVGAAAAAVLLSVAPACAAGPIARMDPIAYHVWYGGLPENMPLWRQPPTIALGIVYFPLCGLLGAGLALRHAASPEERRRWLLVLIFGAATLVTAIVVRRAVGGAHAFAVPGATALVIALRAHAARLARPIVRIPASVAAFLLPSPLMAGYLATILTMLLPFAAGSDRPSPAQACDERCMTVPLLALPPSIMMAPLDLGAPVLFFTPHRIVAANFHRSDKAIADVIRTFAGSADAAHAVVLRRRARYVLIDPAADDVGVYQRLRPDGLMAQLVHGRPPRWLAPVPLAGGRLMLWRVTG